MFWNKILQNFSSCHTLLMFEHQNFLSQWLTFIYSPNYSQFFFFNVTSFFILLSQEMIHTAHNLQPFSQQFFKITKDTGNRNANWLVINNKQYSRSKRLDKVVEDIMCTKWSISAIYVTPRCYMKGIVQRKYYCKDTVLSCCFQWTI